MEAKNTGKRQVKLLEERPTVQPKKDNKPSIDELQSMIMNKLN